VDALAFFQVFDVSKTADRDVGRYELIESATS
jgi:hypothetical protein